MTENSENTVVLNKEPCGTLNDDGCLQIFPYFDGPSVSLCMKCKKFQNAETEEQRTRIRQSCEGCGLCSSQLAEPFCGRCKRRDREAKGLPDPHADAAAARLNLLQKRMGNPNPPSELEAIRTAKSGGHFTVHVFYTTKGVVNKNIGNHSFNLPMDMHLDDVLARAVAHADLEWTADSAHPLSLNVKDCSLRFKGNMSIEPEALSGTLRGLYNFYIGRPDKIHVIANKRLGLAKGTYLAFECSINVQRNILWLMSVKYNQRVVELKARYAEDDDGGSLVSNKRRSNDSSSGEPTKRRRGTGTLSSNVRFANNLGALGYGAPPLAPAKCVEVTFKHFAATVTEEQADMSEISAEQEGRIEVNPLILSISDRGKSKNVYKDKMFAAKKFFDTSNKPNADGTVVVSKRDNDVGLAHDLYRLVRMQMFRSKYMERAAIMNFGEISNFEVSSVFLITIQSALPVLEHDPAGGWGVDQTKGRLANKGIFVARDDLCEILHDHFLEEFDSRVAGRKRAEQHHTPLEAFGPWHQEHSDGHEKLAQISGQPFCTRFFYCPTSGIPMLLSIIIWIWLKTVDGSEVNEMHKVHERLRREAAPFGVQQSSTKNTPIKSFWRWLRDGDGHSVKLILQNGSASGIFLPNDAVHMAVFYWLWVPIIQDGLDTYRAYWNNHKIHKSAMKINPSGSCPINMFTNPASTVAELRVAYGGEEARSKAYRWVSEEFKFNTDVIYYNLGAPERSLSNGWNIFKLMVAKIEELWVTGVDVGLEIIRPAFPPGLLPPRRNRAARAACTFRGPLYLRRGVPLLNKPLSATYHVIDHPTSMDAVARMVQVAEASTSLLVEFSMATSVLALAAKAALPTFHGTASRAAAKLVALREEYPLGARGLRLQALGLRRHGRRMSLFPGSFKGGLGVQHVTIRQTHEVRHPFLLAYMVICY
ncbi:hypothetical protein B0H14DRAFT_3675782 [Mycena olivaceomarginata]|nr:hypothetical protein B0H14DRAFT_3675782 [Mycena olivaceomarginata]